MSLVGTRPPTVDEWDKYELHHRARLATKPGLTGMWQVSGRSNITDFEEVVKLDKQYIPYSIGSEGKYRILRDADERELISNCVIARLKQITMEDLNQEYTKMEIEQKSDSIIKEIDKYLFIIKYELEEINHSRRIGWQDWVIEERKYISYRSVLSKYLTGRRVEKYIIVSIITAITMWACIYIVLKICGTTEIKPIKILQDNISALTILIVSLIFNGIVEIVRRIVRRFFS